VNSVSRGPSNLSVTGCIRTTALASGRLSPSSQRTAAFANAWIARGSTSDSAIRTELFVAASFPSQKGKSALAGAMPDGAKA
jgi:hypothetical protein